MGNIDHLTLKYQDRLKSIPVPGGGGCHTSLLACANFGVLAGLRPEQIQSDIRCHIPQGRRRITDREIREAISKASLDHKGGTFTPKARPEPIVNDGKAALQRIIKQGPISEDIDLWELSPIRLGGEPQEDPVLFLEILYKKTDLIWIGERYDEGIIGKTIRTAEEWITFFRKNGKAGPHIIINPLNGIPVPTKSDDKTTLRGDGNVQEFRYALVEFDNLSREDQIRFWSAAKLPIITLIDSGGKSIHALLEVSKLTEVQTLNQWVTEIKGRLYDRLLTPLGVDCACSNPARLSRLPGCFRKEKATWQKLLWLAPEGRPVYP